MIYVYLNILAQSQILVISLNMNLQKYVIKYKDHLSGRHFYWRRWLGLKLWEFYVDVSDAIWVGSQKGIFEVRKFLYSQRVSNFSPSLTSFLWKRCTPHGLFLFCFSFHEFHFESQLNIIRKNKIWLVKVHIFWEGQKLLQNLHRRFVLCIVPVKSTVEISQNFVAFSEYKNFKIFVKKSDFVFRETMWWCANKSAFHQKKNKLG